MDEKDIFRNVENSELDQDGRELNPQEIEILEQESKAQLNGLNELLEELESQIKNAEEYSERRFLLEIEIDDCKYQIEGLELFIDIKEGDIVTEAE